MLDKLSNYIIVDIGANLTNKKFSRDLDAVIQRAREAGVTKIMVTGTSIHSTKEALRLTRLYPGTLYSTAGQSLTFIAQDSAYVGIISQEYIRTMPSPGMMTLALK